MNKEVFLSIIIPMYNTENYICKCLSSLNNQSYKDFEVILVDDGSKDNSFKIAKEYLKNVDFSYKIFHQSNSGVSKTRNFAMEKAEGKYLIFLDSDDYVDCNLVKKLIEKVKEEKSDSIYFGYDRVNEEGIASWSYEDYHSYTQGNILGKDLLRKVINNKVALSMSNIVFKREIIKKNNIKFIEYFYNGEDQNFIFKVLLLCKKVSSIENVLFHYVMRESSVSHSISAKNLTFIDALEDLSRVIEDKDLVQLVLNKQMFENIKYNFYMMSKVASIKELLIFFKNSKIRKYCNKYINEINYFNNKDKAYIYLLKYCPKILAILLILKEGKNK
ncbi:glycosyltransferase [Clostridium tarantellae]|nr:glycosyltransferase [Clostridium tarantellae]